MKVLLLCNKSPWPPKEGGPIAMHAMIQGLLMAGISVKVLALNTNKYTVDLKEIPEDFRLQTGITFVNIDLSFKPTDAFLNLFTHESYHIKRYMSVEFAKVLTGILKAESFDIIQFESLFLTCYIDLIRQYSSARLVLRAHNVEHLIWQRLAQETTLPLNKWYLKHLAKTLKAYELSILNELDGIAAITTNDEERFRSFGCTKLTGTIPFGISCPQTAPPSTALKPKTLFHIGAMNWLPNQEGIRWFLRECWPMIHVKFPDVRLVLAGREMPGWMLNTVITGVDIMGEVPDATRFMCDNGIMIVPLFSGSGVRVKIIEAMALGKTVISTSIGMEGIKCRPQRDILIADTPEEFLETVISCHNDPEMARQIGENGRKYILENHLLEKVSGLTNAYYQQLIQ
ncbi:MAG: glycosyltransferase family 4 protein, partial [Bacteroidota bacterium]|nr:glycosyltransferase family 4 protein [Bacteroidota bacterium]